MREQLEGSVEAVLPRVLAGSGFAFFRQGQWSVEN